MKVNKKRVKELITSLLDHTPQSPTPERSDFAIMELGQLAAEPDGISVLKLLVKTYQTVEEVERKSVRKACLEAIHHAATKQSTLAPIIKFLEEELSQGNEDYYLIASLARAYVNNQSSRPLRELLLHENDDISHIARESVKEAAIDGQSMEFLIPTLVQLLKSSDGPSSLLASNVLLHAARNGQDLSRATVPLVRAMGRKDGRIAARSAAALAYLRGHKVSLKPHIGSITRMLEGWSQETERRVVIEALRRYAARGREEAGDVLQAMRKVHGLDKRAITRDFMNELEKRAGKLRLIRRRR